MQLKNAKGVNYNMGKLADRAKQLNPYIQLEDGESVTGIYQGWKEVANNFDPEKSQFQYTVIVEGEKKYFKSGSLKIAAIFDNFKEGDTVKITRKGSGTNTKYDIDGVDPKEL